MPITHFTRCFQSVKSSSTHFPVRIYFPTFRNLLLRVLGFTRERETTLTARDTKDAWWQVFFIVVGWDIQNLTYFFNRHSYSIPWGNVDTFFSYLDKMMISTLICLVFGPSNRRHAVIQKKLLASFGLFCSDAWCQPTRKVASRPGAKKWISSFYGLVIGGNNW